MKDVTLYDILEIPENADLEIIKTAFRKLAMRWHPDRNGNSEESRERFITVRHAYEVLSDPEKRSDYDAFRSAKPSAPVSPTSPAASTASAAPKVRRKALPETPFGSLDAVFGRLNRILWEIEDMLQVMLAKGEPRTPEIRRRHQDALLDALIFLDRWVLTPAGFRDYFFDARKIVMDDAMRFREIAARMRNANGAWGDFVHLRDYFYNVRMRSDRFMNKARVADLLRPLPGKELTVADAFFEAENLAVHVLGAWKRGEPPSAYRFTREGFE
jgi:hypothetical protein